MTLGYKATSLTCVIPDVSQILAFKHNNFVDVHEEDIEFIKGLLAGMKWCEMREGYPYHISAYHADKLTRNNITFEIKEL